METEKLLYLAKMGDEGAKEELFLQYRPLLISRSMLEGCISLSDSASWLPIGYFTDLGDSEPRPFKGNFDGQGYRVYI